MFAKRGKIDKLVYQIYPKFFRKTYMEELIGKVIRIDEYNQKVILENRTEIPIFEIVEITGEILKE